MLKDFSTTQSHSATPVGACHAGQRWGDMLTSVCSRLFLAVLCTDSLSVLFALIFCSFPLFVFHLCFCFCVLFLFQRGMLLLWTSGVRRYIQSYKQTMWQSCLCLSATHTHTHTHTPPFTVNLNPYNWLQLPPIGVFVKALWPDHRHGTQCKETERRKGDPNWGKGLFFSVCVCVCVANI